MSHTITCTSGTITPDSIELFELDYASGNIIHPIAGSAETDVTFDPASRGALAYRAFAKEFASRERASTNSL